MKLPLGFYCTILQLNQYKLGLLKVDKVSHYIVSSLHSEKPAGWSATTWKPPVASEKCKFAKWLASGFWLLLSQSSCKEVYLFH